MEKIQRSKTEEVRSIGEFATLYYDDPRMYRFEGEATEETKARQRWILFRGSAAFRSIVPFFFIFFIITLLSGSTNQLVRVFTLGGLLDKPRTQVSSPSLPPPGTS